jgi:hypothetical protein
MPPSDLLQEVGPFPEMPYRCQGACPVTGSMQRPARSYITLTYWGGDSDENGGPLP